MRSTASRSGSRRSAVSENRRRAARIGPAEAGPYKGLLERRGGQVDVEQRAAGRRAAVANPAAERLDDPVAHRQAQSRSLTDGLGREERLEEPRLVIERNARACVFDLQNHTLP